MISKSLWMKALPCPMVQYTPCPRRNLPLCVSSLMKTLLQGNPSSFSPHGAQSSLSEERQLSSTLHRFLRPQLNFQERQIPTSTHLQPPRCTTKGTSLHKLISGTCTILYGFHLEMNGRLHSKPTMVHSSGLVMPEGLTNAPTAFQRFMNTSSWIWSMS